MDVSTAQGVLIALATIVAMEGGAYASHRWIMHGPMWFWHESHHRPRDGAFEKNDWFAVVGALISIAFIFMGTQLKLGSAWTWLGVGVVGYGIVYFLFHDVLVHRRVPHSIVPGSKYLRRIVQAHRLHHVTASREGSVSFGFIYAPPIPQLVAQLRAHREAGRGASHRSAITR
ncbi:MAG: sterol desaturase family protein [Sphingomonadaceae bacterium]|nr:sterol desaturase family protein [Sphingomonadaceae bacterium]